MATSVYVLVFLDFFSTFWHYLTVAVVATSMKETQMTQQIAQETQQEQLETSNRKFLKGEPIAYAEIVDYILPIRTYDKALLMPEVSVIANSIAEDCHAGYDYRLLTSSAEDTIELCSRVIDLTTAQIKSLALSRLLELFREDVQRAREEDQREVCEMGID